MNRLLRVLLILLCFELGVVLMFVPWLTLWERNFFLDRYPALIPYLLNPFVRGAVTGLGVLDILIAADAVRRLRPPRMAARS
jgi:hypothetical protein